MADRRAAGFKVDSQRDRYADAYNRTLSLAGTDVVHHDVPTGFGTTHVVESGDGALPPMVLLHSMSFSSTVWVRNLAAFSRHHRVLAVDTIGDVNLSRSSRRVTGRDDYAEWLTAV